MLRRGTLRTGRPGARSVLAGLALAVGGVVSVGAPAGASPAADGSGTPPQRSDFGPDPYSGSFSRPGFDAVYSGSDHGQVITYFDQDGTPTRLVIHGHGTETDTNIETGKSVVVRSSSTLHAALDADGNPTTWALTGALFLGTAPGEGVVLHDSGRVEQAQQPDGSVLTTALKGVHDSFTSADAFCDALR